MTLQQITNTAKSLWKGSHAQSTINCQSLYFDKFLQQAEELNISTPCQWLYDSFLLSATTKATLFSHFQVVKFVDLIATTHCLKTDGYFINEPVFPDIEEATIFISKQTFPIPCDTDISILIVYAYHTLEKLHLCKGLCNQYWNSFKHIRAYCYQQTNSFLFSKDILIDYLAQNEKLYKNTQISEAKYYNRRKAAYTLLHVFESGCIDWKRELKNHIKPLPDAELEKLRQDYLCYLKTNNYAETTIRTKECIFRYAMLYSGIHSQKELYSISQQTIQTILKGFAEHYICMDLPVEHLKTILQYFYEHSLTQNDCSKLIMKPLVKKGKAVCYIEEKDDEVFFRHLFTTESKRNIAIILLARRLGLRTGDICNLTFDQIDWKNDRLRIRQHKTGEPLVLPLLSDVGNALMEYILSERPLTDSTYPYVFLRSLPPYTKLKRLYAISDSFLKTSGIVCKQKNTRGMHVFRKTLINRMLLDEIPHSIITDTLGHTSKNSDKAYISMEERMLRQCALDLSFTTEVCTNE